MRAHQCILASLLLSVSAVNAPAVTNGLWTARIPRLELRDVPISHALSRIESISKEIDPRGRGVRIVNAAREDTFRVPDVSLSLTDVQLKVALDICVKAAGFAQAFIFDDVAVIGRTSFRYFEYTVHGICIDSVTQSPVDPFVIEYSDAKFGLSSRSVSLSKDGLYSCTVPVLLRLLEAGDGSVLLNDLMRERVVFRVSAPGYKPQTCEKEVFGDTGATSYYVIKLEREVLQEEERGTP